MNEQTMTPGELAILSKMQEFRDECRRDIALCHAELLRQVRQMMGFNRELSKLRQEVQELKQQLTRDRLFDS